MTKTRRRSAFAGLLAAIALVLAACSSQGGKAAQDGDGGVGAGQADTEQITVAMITHGAPGDTFWDLIRQGANAASEKDNVKLIYRASPNAKEQATFVRNVINQGVDGIAITLASPDAMRGVVQQARQAGIPVVAFNQGLQQWQKMGIMSYFGQNPTIAGNAFGDRLNQAGAKHVLCVIQQPSVALDARCNGVKETFEGKQTRLFVNGESNTDMLSKMTAKLQQDSSIDYVVTLGAPVATIAVQAVERSGSGAKVATFDANQQVVKSIKSGAIEWLVDQQPFLQGYLAVDSLWLYNFNGSVIGGGEPVLTGPQIIDQGNIGKIARFNK